MDQNENKERRKEKRIQFSGSVLLDGKCLYKGIDISHDGIYVFTGTTVEEKKIIVGRSAEALKIYQDIVFTAFDWLRVEKVADLSHKHSWGMRLKGWGKRSNIKVNSNKKVWPFKKYLFLKL